MKILCGYELRSKDEPTRVWKDTVEFCMAHDGKFDEKFERNILDIAAEHGLYREVTLTKDGTGMRVDGQFPNLRMFENWLQRRIEVGLWSTILPSGLQKPCYTMSNFYCSVTKPWLTIPLDYHVLSNDFKTRLRDTPYDSSEANKLVGGTK